MLRSLSAICVIYFHSPVFLFPSSISHSCHPGSEGLNVSSSPLQLQLSQGQMQMARTQSFLPGGWGPLPQPRYGALQWVLVSCFCFPCLWESSCQWSNRLPGYLPEKPPDTHTQHLPMFQFSKGQATKKPWAGLCSLVSSYWNGLSQRSLLGVSVYES